MRCRALAALALLLGAACQPVPHPFAHDGAPDTRLLELPDSAGIVVLPVDDAPPAASAALGLAMADALRKANVPATTRGGNRASAWLHGRIVDDGRDAKLVWELSAPDGKPLGAVTRSIEGTPVAAWAAGDKDLMAAIAGNAAPAIAALVQEQTPGEVRVPPIYVQPVEGARGDGNARLRAAMHLALGARQLQTANAPDQTTLVVAGRVTTTSVIGAPEYRRLRLVWKVTDPYGIEVGEIAQENEVPATALESGWQQIAPEAARDAAAGILRMLRGIDWRAGFAGAAPQGGDRQASPAPRGGGGTTSLDRPGRARPPADVEERLQRDMVR